MSGGEQQMLAIARALMARPKLVLLDEPSLGLAPIVTQELFRTLGELNREQGISMLVVEQNAGLALEHRAARLRARDRLDRRRRDRPPSSPATTTSARRTWGSEHVALLHPAA